MEWWEPLLRLLAAAAFAGAIGFDRELRAKPAGLRTNIVVGVAAAAFGVISESAFDPSLQGFDPSRVASQVVTGVGFLGAGAIFAAGGKPQGLTTAAALWGSAAAGLSAGVGSLLVGLAVGVITLLVLQPLDWVARSLLGRRRREDSRIDIVVTDLQAAGEVRHLVRIAGVRLDDLELRPFGDRIAIAAVFHGTRHDITDLLRRIEDRDDVLFASEEAIPPEER